MKIAVVTLISDNYGNKYQNYAVEQLLQTYGEVTTFGVEGKMPLTDEKITNKYRLTINRIKRAVEWRLRVKYDITNARRGILGNLFYVALHDKALKESRKRRSLSFSKFSEQWLNICSEPITAENCEAMQKEFTYFVCGSDQIWNPSYKTSSLSFLSFAPKEKTIALAPSFGVRSIPNRYIEYYASWIAHIQYLSAREETGVSIIKALTGRDAELLADPTMALTEKQWINIMCEPSICMPRRYIICYFLGKVNRAYWQYIKFQANVLNAQIVDLFNIEEKKYYEMGPSEVLYCLYNAVYVYTDSYHGTVFSLLFKKDFVVFTRNEEGLEMNSRLETLLKKYGVQDRCFDPERKYYPINTDRWAEIDQQLEKERKKIYSYLDHCFSKVDVSCKNESFENKEAGTVNAG